MKLPYPVFDAKGTAKYDKTSKSLTVTLPVRPPPAVPLTPATPQKGDSSAVAEAVVQELGDYADASSGSPAKTTPVKKSSVGHNRWVEGSAGSAASAGSGTGRGDSGQGEAALSLHEEVKRQAEAALQAAKLAAANKPAQQAPAPATAASPASPSKPTPTTTSVPAPATSTAAFIPAPAFAGRKEGYCFKKDSLGLGYYADAKQGASKAPVPAILWRWRTSTPPL